MESLKAILAINSEQRGYTMLEILVVIAIGAILVAIAAPSLQDTLNRNARDSIQLDLLSSLALARSQAVTLSTTVSVCHSSNQSSCSNSSGSDWDDGWLVFSDYDADGVVDTADGDEIYQVHASANGIVAIELNSSTNGNVTDEVIQFDDDGFLANSAGGAYFKFCGQENIDANARAIWIANSGRPSQSIDDGDGIHNDLSGNNLSCP